MLSCKRAKPLHPPLLMENIKIFRVNEHMHLGILLDSHLNFLTHIGTAIL